jgi:hypothetical protein
MQISGDFAVVVAAVTRQSMMGPGPSPRKQCQGIELGGPLSCGTIGLDQRPVQLDEFRLASD